MTAALLLVALLSHPEYTIRESVTTRHPGLALLGIATDQPEGVERLAVMSATLRSRGAESRAFKVLAGSLPRSQAPDPNDLSGAALERLYFALPPAGRLWCDTQPHRDGGTRYTDAGHWVRELSGPPLYVLW